MPRYTATCGDCSSTTCKIKTDNLAQYDGYFLVTMQEFCDAFEVRK